jgi:hemoglobin
MSTTPDESAISSVYGMIGDSGFQRLCAAFYRRIPGDDLLGPLYPPDDLVGAEHRLRGFLIFRFGGPDRYLQERGHPQLRMRHAPFAIPQDVRDRWVQLMDEALVEAQLPEPATSIIQPFLHHVATFLINRGSKPNMVS